MIACVYLPADASHVPALVALAQDFSPRFEVLGREVVLIDVSGLDRLVGDADAVGAAICRLARARGLPVTVALAPTRTAAIILALADATGASQPGGQHQPGKRSASYRLVRRGDIAAALAPLPLTMLSALRRAEAPDELGPNSDARARPPRRGDGHRTHGAGRHYRLAPSPGASPSIDRHALLGDLLQTLSRWGLKTLGDLTALPAIELFERLGSAGVAWQAVARGEDARPLVRMVPDDPFEATMTLEWPVETLEPLSFVLGRLLEPLCLRLERTERGAAALQTTLQLVSKALHVRVLELPAPMRDAKVLRTLILLDLESHPPDAGIDRVTLTIEPTPGRVIQHSLLSRARPSPEQMATLTARLTAVLGEGRVGSPGLVDSYAPGAFTLYGFDGDANLSKPVQPLLAEPARKRHTGFVLRRFREPTSVRVERIGGCPVRITTRSARVRGGAIVQAAGPWRTSGAWWAAVSSEREEALQYLPWDRDEWDVVLHDGTALRLSRDRATESWCVEGVLD